jgi:CRISPR-associated protein Csd2
MLWRAFTLMFEHDRASTRGEMALRGLYVFTHADKFGSAPAHSLFERIRIAPVGQVPARSYADYKVELPGTTELPAGVSFTALHG